MADHLKPPSSLFLEFCSYTPLNVHFCTFFRCSVERERERERERGTSIFLLLFMLLLLFPEREIFCSDQARNGKKKKETWIILSKFIISISVQVNGAFSSEKSWFSFAKTEPKANPQTVHGASLSLHAYEARTHENRCQIELCRVVSCCI
ncbi:hypothetical protein M6B38_320635 [Iris pallida]|uniref:Uncharacterized protein n=1 Tax=Iris pallida TaxID=29817 RepID=A0AAX6HBI6_IRIPA|nr:hypothetical protein M6B38_320635 [Iris pallida]